MPEEHAHHHNFDDFEGLTPQELAANRWKAIEGANCAPGLSPIARRICFKLITSMDAKARTSYPSEHRMAAELGVHPSAVKKAKAELKRASLITWSNPGGPRHLSRYSFNWELLLTHSREAKERGNAAVARGRDFKRQSTRAGTNESNSHSTHAGTKENVELADTRKPKVPKIEIQGTQNMFNSTRAGTVVVPSRVPDITQDITLKDITHHHAIASNGGGTATDVDHNSDLTTRLQLAEALEEKAQLQKRTGIKILDEAFASEPEVLTTFIGLREGGRHRAIMLLTSRGPEEARNFIYKRASGGIAA